MLPSRVLRSTSARLFSWYAAVFGLSVVLLLGAVYWIAAAALDGQLRESIDHELDVLVELQRTGGSARLARAVQLRAADLRPPRRYYLLQGADGERIAGNLPTMRPVEGALLLPARLLAAEDATKPEPAADAHPVVAHGRVLENGSFLLVGESRYRALRAREAILHALGWGMLVTVLLAAAGGAVLGSRFLRRIEEINRTARSIMDGDLARRVPLRGSGDEMDQLAENLNAMLDRIQDLMESVKRVSDDIAHDLRSPLSRLRQRLEAARLGADGRSEEVIEQSIAELDAILETFAALLRISQIEAGARRSAFAEIRLDEIVARVCETFAPVAEDRGQRLEHATEPLAPIRGDRELLTQMVANLVENPIRHCPAGTQIRVRLARERGAPVLCVTDTGPGIPSAEREKVFRRFYRLDASRSSPGTGLGLALVKAIAELHGAAVELADNAPGLRAVVRFPPAARE